MMLSWFCFIFKFVILVFLLCFRFGICVSVLGSGFHFWVLWSAFSLSATIYIWPSYLRKSIYRRQEPQLFPECEKSFLLITRGYKALNAISNRNKTEKLIALRVLRSRKQLYRKGSHYSWNSWTTPGFFEIFLMSETHNEGSLTTFVIFNILETWSRYNWL